MSKRKYLLKNTALFGISTISTKLIAFIMVPFYTYFLTTENFGTIDIIITTKNLLYPLLSLSIYNSVLRYSMDKNSNHREVFTNGVIITFIGVILGLLIIPTINNIDFLSSYSWQIYCLVVLNCIYSLLSEFARGMERIKIFIFANIILVFLTSLSNIIFIGIFELGISGYIYATILSFTLTILYLAFKIRIYKYLKFDLNYFKNSTLFKNMLFYSLFLIPNTFSWWIINSSNKYAILYFHSGALIGIYAVAFRIPLLIKTTSQIFVQSWQLSAMKEYGNSSSAKFTNSIFNKMCIILIISSSGLITILKLFVKFYVSDEYFIAWQSASFLIISASLSIVAAFIGTSYVAAKKNKGNMISTMIGALVNSILIFVLIPKWGLNGAAFAICISYLTVIIYRFYDTKKFVLINTISNHILFSSVVVFIQIYILFNTVELVSVLNIVLFFIILLINKKDIKELINNLIRAKKKAKIVS